MKHMEKVRKLITFTPEQHELMQRLMKERYQSSTSAFFVGLMSEVERGAPRSVGRPKNPTRGKDNEEEDTNLYKAPDWPMTKSAYTRTDIEAWYAFRNLPVPEDAFKLFPAKGQS